MRYRPSPREAVSRDILRVVRITPAGAEVPRLEWRFTKAEILESDLNQVSCARQRRGFGSR